MRKALWIVFVLVSVFNIISYFVLPDRVASQFGPGGKPTGWMSKEVNILIIQLTETLMLFMVLVVPCLILKIPKQLVSLPHKEYWLAEENRPLIHHVMLTYMSEIGISLLLFLLVLGAFVMKANLSQPPKLNETCFFVVLGVFLAHMIIWCIRLILALKKPEEV